MELPHPNSSAAVSPRAGAVPKRSTEASIPLFAPDAGLAKRQRLAMLSAAASDILERSTRAYVSVAAQAKRAQTPLEAYSAPEIRQMAQSHQTPRLPLPPTPKLLNKPVGADRKMTLDQLVPYALLPNRPGIVGAWQEATRRGLPLSSKQLLAVFALVGYPALLRPYWTHLCVRGKVAPARFQIVDAFLVRLILEPPTTAEGHGLLDSNPEVVLAMMRLMSQTASEALLDLPVMVFDAEGEAHLAL